MDRRIEQLHSFPPVIGRSSRVLVLGTMPGAVSLRETEYYAHPRNRFWRIMETFTGVSPKAPYDERLAALAGVGIALWDTLERCERVGSLDARIRNAEPNDVGGLLARYPAVRAVALNGRKAAAVFRRRILPRLPSEIGGALAVLDLPSTSPANARGGPGAVLREWRRLEEWLA